MQKQMLLHLSINSIIRVKEYLKLIIERFRNTDNQDVTMKEVAMCGKPSSEETEFDDKKSARDIADGMAVAGLTPVGKLAPTVIIES
ncbi:hypothetical protein B4082_3924 [Bacillus cereus]|uniref:Uncharacterized protein n=1 Tax=Bacillus cereus TaxID=1396 RepID=A0A161RE33_BACCE|nr:hypothetical protein B4082_3924 [Bacillus cereus]